MRLSTQAHTNPEFIALCREKSLLLWAFGQWEVECEVNDVKLVTSCHTLETAPGHAGPPQQCLWAAVDTGPSFPAAQLSSKWMAQVSQLESLGG